MSQRPTVHELHQAALVSESPDPRLTTKGREWLRTLEELQTREVVESDRPRSFEDLISSISGLGR